MKILILTLPRTGSKFLQSNLSNYVQTNFGDSIALQNNGYRDDSVGELLCSLNSTYNICRATKFNNKIVLARDYSINPNRSRNKQLADFFPEFVKRVDFLSDGSWVGKFFAEFTDDRYYHILFNSICPLVDKIIIINRNQFDVAISLMISVIFRTFTSNDKQRRVISDLVLNPIELDVKRFGNIVDRTSYFYSDVMSVAKAKFNEKVAIISFEELISLTSQSEILRKLQLPNYPFDFKLGSIEYGLNKQLMIKNIDQLREKYNQCTP